MLAKKNENVLNRCVWVPEGNALYQCYHDKEWGVPVHNDERHFEFLVLEGAQAGLSWLTILKRRDMYKKAFANFDVHRICAFTNEEISDILMNSGVVKNNLKVQSVIINARHFIQIQKEYTSFDRYIWEFVNHKPIQNQWKNHHEVPAETPISREISKDLKKRGFKFVGPTIIYAYMQAIGMVNDHTIDCFRYAVLH